jgi:hypothetical protein
MTISLAELKQQARQRADMVNSNFVDDVELTGYINNSIAELHDILCEAYGSDYFVLSVEDTIVSNQSDYTLPTDFYELKGVDIRVNNDAWLTVRRFNFNERNRDSDFNVWDFAGVTNVRYRLVGNKLKFSPVPDRNATYRLWYVPVATKLVNDTDTLDDLNAYSEYVIVDAAIKMMQKEESDVMFLAAQKTALEKRIRDKSLNRDAGQAGTVSDIYAENDDYFWRRGN